jgi:hypothetical protein
MTKIYMLFAGLAAFALAAPAMAQDAGTYKGLSGNWKIVSNVGGKTRLSDCNFVNTGATFTGQCKRDDGTTVLTGSVDKAGIHMSGKSSYIGMPITLTYEATLTDPKNGKGTIVVHPFGVHGDFTMTQP